MPNDWPREARPDPNGPNGAISIGFGRWRLGVKGTSAVLLVMFGLLVVAGARELDRLRSETTTGRETAVAALREDHQRILQNQEALTREMQLISYLLSLPADQRPRLAPPAALWERLHPRPRDGEDEPMLRRRKER